jgi:hypothetical protein
MQQMIDSGQIQLVHKELDDDDDRQPSARMSGGADMGAPRCGSEQSARSSLTGMAVGT